MIALIQRVSKAGVRVDGQDIASIGAGLLALVAVQPGDGPAEAARMAERLLAHRVFPHAGGRMNLGLDAVGGELLLVPQFTLAADTRRGNRASFTSAASPEQGERMFRLLVEEARHRWPKVATGEFGADMAVSLVNDGPVTFWLETGPARGAAIRQ